MNCKNCKKCVVKAHDVSYNGATTNQRSANMEDKEIATIPYFAHESESNSPQENAKNQ